MFEFNLRTALCLATLVIISGCTPNDSDPEPTNAAPVATPVVPAVEGDGNGNEVPAPTPNPNPAPAPAPAPTPAPAPAPEPIVNLGEPNICTSDGINAWVDAQMRDYYIYFDQVPVVDPTDFDSPSDLLDVLRVSPDVFSSIGPQAVSENLFQAGETFGFGFRWNRDQQGALRFSNIVSGSPMHDAGALRGDRVLALNGVPELDLTDNLVDQFLGEPGVATTVVMTIASGDAEPRDIEVTSSIYVINTVSEVRTYDVGGNTVGYINSSIFLRTSEAELDQAVETLIDANPTDVILDFRYNGGGFVYIAKKFAAQLLGPDFTGDAFQTTSFNSRYENFNRTSVYDPQDLNLSLPRVVILTTRNTASASEAIANSC